MTKEAGEEAGRTARQSPAAKFCPECGESLNPPGFVQEFWVASESFVFCWCAACHWRGEVVSAMRVMSIEALED